MLIEDKIYIPLKNWVRMEWGNTVWYSLQRQVNKITTSFSFNIFNFGSYVQYLAKICGWSSGFIE